MKLATYKDGSRDGQLVVVSRDLSTAHYATGIAGKLQQVLDDWGFMSPQLQDLYETLNSGKARHAFPFDPALCMAPLPRAYQWADGSAYINHVELVRAARSSEVPESFYTDPLMYQGGSDDFLGPCDDVIVPREEYRHRLRGRDRRDHRRRADDRDARTGAGRHPPGDDRQRRVTAQPDPGRTGQGLRLLPEQARHRVQPRGRHARRARRRLGPWPAAPHAAKRLERPQGRHVRGRPGDDLPLRPADRPHLQDAQRARRQHRRLGHREQQGRAPRRRQDRMAQGLQLHRREARDRNHPGRQALHRVHEVRRHDPDRDEGQGRAEHLRRDRAEDRARRRDSRYWGATK